jgi:hypothetical protein
MPRRDASTYVLATLLVVLELPMLAVLGLATLVTRALVAVAGSLRRGP